MAGKELSFPEKVFPLVTRNEIRSYNMEDWEQASNVYFINFDFFFPVESEQALPARVT